MIELLSPKHDRESFDCGNELLTNYLKTQAGQDIKRRLAVCFVLTQNQTKTIKGYYTLSNNSIPSERFSDQIRRKFPKSYTSIPTTLLGRLAVDLNYQGSGIGKILLIDALKRSYDLSRKMGSFAVVVDPIDEEAEKFYAKYDFIQLPDSKKMFIAMQTLKQLFDPAS